MTTQPIAKWQLWTGRIISILCTLFFLLDAVMKIAESQPAVQGSIQLGWPGNSVMSLGFVLLACTVLYAIPATAILGAVLLTGYLGGAVSVMFRASVEGHPYIFPVIFGILTWAGIYLRERRLQQLFPLTKTTA